MWWKKSQKQIFFLEIRQFVFRESENIMTEYSFICILTKFHTNFFSPVLGKVTNSWWYPSSPHFLSLVLSNPPPLVGIQVLQVHIIIIIIIIIIFPLLCKAPQMWPTAFNSQESRCESSTGEKNGLPQYTLRLLTFCGSLCRKECGQEIAKPTHHSHCSCSKGCVTLWPCHLH